MNPCKTIRLSILGLLVMLGCRALHSQAAELYIAGEQSNNIVRFDPMTGTFIDEFVGPLTQYRGLTDLTFGPDGNLYVSQADDNNIMCYDGVTGTYLRDFHDFAHLGGPVALAFIPEPATLCLLVLGGLAAMGRRR